MSTLIARSAATAVENSNKPVAQKRSFVTPRIQQVKRLTLMMEHKQDHFNHDIRKKERETLQLKERLSKKIMEKKTEKGKTTKSLFDFFLFASKY